MKCEPKQIGNPTDLGWYKHKCRNCGKVFPPSPTPPIGECVAVTTSRIPFVHVGVRLSRLAVVTTYFDPHHSEIRLANYRRFTEGMRHHGIEVYTAEGVLAGDSPVLAGEPRCTQYGLYARLWHKERLLNLAIKSLSADVDAVGWFDADITFQKTEKCGCRGGVKGGILQALGMSPIIQPWRQVEWIGEDGHFVPWSKGQRWAISMAAKNSTIGAKGKPCTIPSWAHPGMAWAARRETLDAMGGLFDMHPLGGADTMMASAFWGQFDSPYFNHYSKPMIDAWRPWADRAFDVVKNNVGRLDTRITHLYHGTIKARQYRNRVLDMCRLGIDPAKHLATADNGTLTWAPGTPQAIIDYHSEYFTRREEIDQCHSTQTAEIASITA